MRKYGKADLGHKYIYLIKTKNFVEEIYQRHHRPITKLYQKPIMIYLKLAILQSQASIVQYITLKPISYNINKQNTYIYSFNDQYRPKVNKFIKKYKKNRKNQTSYVTKYAVNNLIKNIFFQSIKNNLHNFFRVIIKTYFSDAHHIIKKNFFNNLNKLEEKNLKYIKFFLTKPYYQLKAKNFSYDSLFSQLYTIDYLIANCQRKSLKKFNQPNINYYINHKRGFTLKKINPIKILLLESFCDSKIINYKSYKNDEYLYSKYNIKRFYKKIQLATQNSYQEKFIKQYYNTNPKFFNKKTEIHNQHIIKNSKFKNILYTTINNEPKENNSYHTVDMKSSSQINLNGKKINYKEIKSLFVSNLFRAIQAKNFMTNIFNKIILKPIIYSDNQLINQLTDNKFTNTIQVRKLREFFSKNIQSVIKTTANFIYNSSNNLRFSPLLDQHKSYSFTKSKVFVFKKLTANIPEIKSQSLQNEKIISVAKKSQVQSMVFNKTSKTEKLLNLTNHELQQMADKIYYIIQKKVALQADRKGLY